MDINWNEILSDDDRQFLYGQGCDIGEHDGDSFLIIPSWDIIEDSRFKKYFDDSWNWGFDDEYSSCAECYTNIIRISPNSYSWQPDFYMDDEYGYICKECAQDYQDHAIQEIQDKIDNNNQPKSYPVIFDISDEWQEIKLSDSYHSWRNGMHKGMNDDPLRQGKIVRSITIDNKPIFQIIFRVYPSQFYIELDSYIRIDPELDVNFRPDEWQEIIKSFVDRFNSSEGRFPYDIATLYEKALKNIEYPYSSINVNPDDGTIDIQGSNDLNEYLENIRK
ncbi:MAG: hypothetical protein ACW99Q_22600 [Candidatus Kariarchaeaceae archaeon]|jgi:hypothetical protein